MTRPGDPRARTVAPHRESRAEPRHDAGMHGREPKLVKTSGFLETFQERKLRASLARSGASRQEVEHAVDAVRKRLRDGMPTDEVFRIAHRALRHDRRPAAARYSLQRAILQLGPSGFPFERFIAELWQHEGYRARLGVRLQGRFVRHEVDIDATRGKERVLAECKFRGQSDGKVDIKVALYVFARARDLIPTGFRQFWLITNGRFTKDALAYGKGVGLRLLSWDYPKGDSLRERIDRAGLHPVTVLSSLQKAERQRLLRENIVLCTDLVRHPSVVDELGMSPHRARQLWQEVDGLVGRRRRASIAGGDAHGERRAATAQRHPGAPRHRS